MAKKSSSSRHKPTTAQRKAPAQKQQAPERNSTATLVRPGGATGPSAANVVVEAPVEASEPQPKPQPKPAPRKTAVATKTTTAEKPAVAEKTVAPTPAAAPKPAAARPSAATSAREQNAQIARVRATQRARTARAISAENYAYVLSDLKLVVGLAVSAFVVLIALTFVLPH